MKLYKNRHQKTYENLRKILNGKSNYLKNLDKKKNDGLDSIKEKRIGIIIEEILELNKYKRDYSHFSSNNSSRAKDKITPVKIHFSHAIKYPIKKNLEKSYSNKKHNIKFGKLPFLKNNNYSEFPKSNLPIRFIHSIDNINKLAHAGKLIITKNQSQNQ